MCLYKELCVQRLNDRSFPEIVGAVDESDMDASGRTQKCDQSTGMMEG